MSPWNFFFFFLFNRFLAGIGNIYLNFLNSRSCWRWPAGLWWGPIVEGYFEGKGPKVQFLPACPVGLQWMEQRAEEFLD